MKHKILIGFSLFILIAGLIFGYAPAQSQSVDCDNMPANPDKILSALIARGEVAADASVAEKSAAVQAYLTLKLANCEPDRNANILARKQVLAAEAALQNTPGEIRGHKLGQDYETVEPSNPQFKPVEDSGKLLLILVDFSDTPFTWQPIEGDERTEAGPLYNQIPVPDNDFDLWVEDFSTQHFQEMMFTPGGWSFSDTHPYYPGEKRGSMRDYFLEQSYGKYLVEGDTFGWFTVDKPEAYYGDDSLDGGIDNLRPGTVGDLLEDAVQVINDQNAIPWLDYDISDPYDIDGDGELNEPDCIIDHPLFVHAGIDQSGGGGAQGDDSIWAHSSGTDIIVTAEGACEWPELFGGTLLYNYTIMPEDGGVGVFAHEYAHDLGLPDEYDTIYSGYGASTAFWTLQSSGSWIGRPAQTQPAGMSAWAKYALGWLDPNDNLAVLNIDELGLEPDILRLEQTERWGGEETINGVKVNLPDKYFFVNDPNSGDWEWFGGKADEIDTTLARSVDLSGATSAELSFWTWYDIEAEWDFGFVQVSTDGGAAWTSLAIEGTSSDYDPDAMPSIVANLPGFTGSSGGWVNKTFDLSAYLGSVIELQFRYMTDWGTTMPGFYIDDINVTADGTSLFLDDVETLDPTWVVDGWVRDQGSGSKPHYYIMEWRNLNPMETPYEGETIVNTDAGLNNAYNYDPFGPTPNQPQYFPYTPGLLLFYRDMTFTDNWTGAHPGGGFLLVVDAHKQPFNRPPNLLPENPPVLEPPLPSNYGGLVWDTRVLSYDATFSNLAAADITLTRYTTTRTYKAFSPVPSFNDAKSYWSERAPSASVITPNHGLLFRILGQAEDNSAISIGFGNRNKLEETYTSPFVDFFLMYEYYFLPMIVH